MKEMRYKKKKQEDDDEAVYNALLKSCTGFFYTEKECAGDKIIEHMKYEKPNLNAIMFFYSL